MRITIVTLGTRGDVQPYVALALGLKNAGHHVRLATHALFRNFVTGYGIDFAALPIDPQDLLAAEEDRNGLILSATPSATSTRL